MSYEKNKDDNGRVEGTFDTLDVSHVVGKFNYGDKDVEENVEVGREVTDE